MRRLIIIVVIGFLAWQAYAKYQSIRTASAGDGGIVDVAEPSSPPVAQRQASPATRFKCDGRTHCSQMTSCAEATYFLKNCPGVKMDGDNDRVPCEQEWCR